MNNNASVNKQLRNLPLWATFLRWWLLLSIIKFAFEIGQVLAWTTGILKVQILLEKASAKSWTLNLQISNSFWMIGYHFWACRKRLTWWSSSSTSILRIFGHWQIGCPSFAWSVRWSLSWRQWKCNCNLLALEMRWCRSWKAFLGCWTLELMIRNLQGR